MNTDKKTIVILYSKGFYDTVALDLTARLRSRDSRGEGARSDRALPCRRTLSNRG